MEDVDVIFVLWVRRWNLRAARWTEWRALPAEREVRRGRDTIAGRVRCHEESVYLPAGVSPTPPQTKGRS